MDPPAVVRAQGHSPARDGACQTSRNRSAARSVPTSRNGPRPQAPAPYPGNRHSPKSRSGTHPWIRGRTPRGPIAGFPHSSNAQPPPAGYQARDRGSAPRCSRTAPRPGPCPGAALCRGVLPVLARPMRSQVEVHAWNCGQLGCHVLLCELVKSPFCRPLWPGPGCRARGGGADRWRARDDPLPDAVWSRWSWPETGRPVRRRRGERRPARSGQRRYRLARDAGRHGATGLYVCVDDLEDELIRAIGAARVEELIDSQGDLGSFRSLQRQPEWRGPPAGSQLRRFLGSGSGVALNTFGSGIP